MTEPVRVGENLEGIQAQIARIRAKQKAVGRVPYDSLVKCKTCRDTGFEELKGLGDGLSIGTVRHCPAGCTPPKPESYRRPAMKPHPVPNSDEVF